MLLGFLFLFIAAAATLISVDATISIELLKMIEIIIGPVVLIIVPLYFIAQYQSKKKANEITYASVKPG